MVLLHAGSEEVTTIKETAQCLFIKISLRPSCRNLRVSIRPYLNFTPYYPSAATILNFALRGTCGKISKMLIYLCFLKRVEERWLKTWPHTQ